MIKGNEDQVKRTLFFISTGHFKEIIYYNLHSAKYLTTYAVKYDAPNFIYIEFKYTVL
jgi:hypothetical protein